MLHGDPDKPQPLDYQRVRVVYVLDVHDAINLFVSIAAASFGAGFYLWWLTH